MEKFSKVLEKKAIPGGARITGVSPAQQKAKPVAGGVNFELPVVEKNANALWDERLQLVGKLSNNASESFRILRSRILFPLHGGDAPRTIMVTSTAPEEGKSFVAANLAIMLAQGVDQYSMLVDCDLRTPAIAKIFGIGNVSGLVNHLEHGDDLGELIQKCSVPKLSLLTSGLSPTNPSELLGSEKMDDLVRELSQRYDDRFIVFDSPPLQIASESLVLSQKVDAVILVVRYGVGAREQVLRCVGNIGREKILGVVFNGVKQNIVERKILKQYSPFDRSSAEETQ